MGRLVMGRDNGEAVNVMVLVGKCAGYQTNEMNHKHSGTQ